MEPEVLTAILGATAAIIVSVVSLFSSVTLNRRASLQAQKLEILKQSLSQEDKQLERYLKALEKSIQVIQRIKDDMEVIILSVDESLDSIAAHKTIKKSQEDLTTTFGVENSVLQSSDRKAFHTAKAISLRVEQLVKIHEGDELRTQLSILRTALTDKQNILRDSRFRNYDSWINGRFSCFLKEGKLND